MLKVSIPICRHATACVYVCTRVRVKMHTVVLLITAENYFSVYSQNEMLSNNVNECATPKRHTVDGALEYDAGTKQPDTK